MPKRSTRQRSLRTQRQGNELRAQRVRFVSRGSAILKLTKLKATSKTLIVFEGADNRKPTAEHVHASLWYDPSNIASNLVWTYMLTEIKPNRHGDSANYLYADGHVDTIPEETVFDWVQQNIAKGTNFARPQ